jgi:dimeric dUTPase (all-alpha-NTP-PPase superfamily)
MFDNEIMNLLHEENLFSKNKLIYILFNSKPLATMETFLDTELMDKMDEIFNLQEKLNTRIGVNMNEMNDEDRAKWILNYIRAMQQELAELTDSVPWKWWAKYQEFDKQNARVEIVDLFHFLISLAQVMGMSADDVYDAYLKKNKVNHNRQDSGYSSKDEDDSRHI